MTKPRESKIKSLARHAQCFFVLSLLLAVFFQLYSANSAKAVDLWDSAKQGGIDKIGDQAYGNPGTPADLTAVVISVIKVFLGLLGLIFLILLILAGFKYMTSGGKEEKVKEATAQIQTAVIGLLIIIISYSLVVFVIQKFIFVTTGINQPR